MFIKSFFGNYSVNFGNYKLFLKKYYCKNDIIISDDFFKGKFPKSINSKIIYLKVNENTKSFENLSSVLKKIIKLKPNKNSSLFAIGGGITQDVTAFISSVLLRGVNWYFIPTTLLAMGDSCIGSKTSINLFGYKNLIGNFYPPKKINIDTKLAKSLSSSHFLSGVGEISHYYFVANKNNFKFLVNFLKSNRNQSQLNILILNSLKIKKKFIEKDEFDKNERILLNFGHTFGHALESYYQYKILHGLAVVIGMMVSVTVSYKMNFLSENDYNYMNKILKSIYIERGINFKKINIEQYSKILMKDKKTKGEYLRPILTKGIGKMFVQNIKIDNKFKKILSDFFISY